MVDVLGSGGRDGLGRVNEANPAVAVGEAFLVKRTQVRGERVY